MDDNSQKSNDWVLMTDSSATNKGMRAGCVLISPNSCQLKYVLVLSFYATNNQAEYEALIVGLLIAWGVGVTGLHIKCDSLLVVHQLTGDSSTKTSKMQAYLAQARELLGHFQHYSVALIP